MKNKHNTNNNNKPSNGVTTTSGSSKGRNYCRCCLFTVALVAILLLVLFYYLPVDTRFKLTYPYRRHPLEKPQYVGPLTINSELNKAEKLFANKIGAAEASAVDSKRNFYTGVEGGFIVYVDTLKDTLTVVASLNSPLVSYNANQSDHFAPSENHYASHDDDTELFISTDLDHTKPGEATTMFKYCKEDILLYGEQASYLPEIIKNSRCSRPLGLRLSPDETFLYVIDPYNGLFRVNLTQFKDNIASPAAPAQVKLLIDSKKHHKSLSHTSRSHFRFLDDLAVDWKAGPTGGDIIYMSDVSSKWTLEELIYVLSELDDTGRILSFDTHTQLLSVLDTVTPIRYGFAHLQTTTTTTTTTAEAEAEADLFDERKMNFPNGIELMDDRQAILISDLGNARILKHYIKGPKKDSTELWASFPGFPDNIKRGADADRETYWVASYCAIEDANHFDVVYLTLHYPIFRRLAVKVCFFVGSLLEYFGEHILRSHIIRHFGYTTKFIWQQGSLFCRHGHVIQYDNNGNVLRSLHAPNIGSAWVISEAREVVVQPADVRLAAKRYLYLFSTLYSYLGRVELQL